MPINPNPYTIYYLDTASVSQVVTLDRNVLAFSKQGVYYDDGTTFFFIPIGRVLAITSDAGLTLGI